MGSPYSKPESPCCSTGLSDYASCERNRGNCSAGYRNDGRPKATGRSTSRLHRAFQKFTMKRRSSFARRNRISRALTGCRDRMIRIIRELESAHAEADRRTNPSHPPATLEQMHTGSSSRICSSCGRNPDPATFILDFPVEVSPLSNTKGYYRSWSDSSLHRRVESPCFF